MKKEKPSLKHLALLLFGLLLFAQVSSTDLPFLGKEYIVLSVIQIYLIAAHVVIPKLTKKQS